MSKAKENYVKLPSITNYSNSKKTTEHNRNKQLFLLSLQKYIMPKANTTSIKNNFKKPAINRKMRRVNNSFCDAHGLYLTDNVKINLIKCK